MNTLQAKTEIGPGPRNLITRITAAAPCNGVTPTLVTSFRLKLDHPLEYPGDKNRLNLGPEGANAYYGWWYPKEKGEPVTCPYHDIFVRLITKEIEKVRATYRLPTDTPAEDTAQSVAREMEGRIAKWKYETGWISDPEVILNHASFKSLIFRRFCS